MKIVVTAFTLLMCCASAMAAPATEEYVLGPQDHVKVKVYDWRYATGDAHEWPALVGEFVVNASGNISFPIVGELPAANLNTSQLALDLAAVLQKRVGLAQLPIASVEVFQYRPFYIIGSVEKPGEYAYRPQLTVLQALGVAGGLQRVSDLSALGFQRDAVTSRGDVMAMRAEEALSSVRLKRIQAEIMDADSFDLQVSSVNDVSSDAKGLMQEERRIFDNDKHARLALRETARQTKEFLTADIATLRAKEVTVQRQVQLTQREMDSVSSLVNKGLVITSRLTSLEETLAQLQSSLLDIHLAIAKAQQEIIRSAQVLSESLDKEKGALLSEGVALRNRLALIETKLGTAQTLAAQAEYIAQTNGQSAAEPKFTLSRPDASGVLRNIPAEESDLVRPGDTLRVDWQMSLTKRSRLPLDERDALR